MDLVKLRDDLEDEVKDVIAAFTNANAAQEHAAKKFNNLLKKLESVSDSDELSVEDKEEFLEDVEDNVICDIGYSTHGYRDGFEFWLASDHCW